ncbi:nucleotide sugar dehydrogenase [Amycolatopsis panacis]|uniref:Nucleotide sugar dehydrogenase n=1 Tax=Amycolatopsis panacis TaxID=2340917 RepID=A0A419I8M0_9PSEU|nr:nucleotide sugar dehydrogenase [Amycolatopsis panacis]RJQ88418.1 nucleotide sugar dehydrogenase [Amycolatopsis panacis]
MDLAIIGLGYVGLPLAAAACRVGLTVAGLDSDPSVVEGLRAGTSHVDDISGGEVREMLGAGFRPTTDPRVLGRAGTVVICVPSPLTGDGEPDLGAIRAAAEAVAANLRPGVLVVLESTTFPGTTDEIVRPILERSGLLAGRDFHLAFSPERIDPGNTAHPVRKIPKVVGGHTGACGAAAAAFYGKFVSSVHQAKGTREAELAKLLENTYRQVNIALVNEMAMFSRELDIDLWDAIDCASTKPFGFQTFHPGPGVGGHCIPVDPVLLTHRVRSLGHSFRIAELAQQINAQMPDYVAGRARKLLDRHGHALSGASVLLCGITYKADIADLRETPAKPIAEQLHRLGAEVRFHDPYVGTWQVGGRTVRCESRLEEALEAADLTLVVTSHREYDPATLIGRARLLLDTRGRLRAHTGDTVEVL